MTFLSKIVCGSYINLFLKLPIGKLESWFFLWSFFHTRFCLIFLNILFGLVCKTVVMFDLVLLIPFWLGWMRYRNGYVGLVGPTIAVSLELLCHCWNVTSLRRFFRFFLCSFEVPRSVFRPYYCGMFTYYYINCMIFWSQYFFPVRPWNSLPTECFPLMREPNSRVNKHLLSFATF